MRRLNSLAIAALLVRLLPTVEALFRLRGGVQPSENSTQAGQTQAGQTQVRRVCRVKGQCLEYTVQSVQLLHGGNATVGQNSSAAAAVSALGGATVTGAGASDTELHGFGLQLDMNYEGEVEDADNTTIQTKAANNLCIAGKLAPQFFLLGAQKSATTNFFSRLMEVALDVVPATPVRERGDPDYFYKEPHIFDVSERYHGFGVDGWLKLYPDCSQFVKAIATDATPSYISSPLAPARIQLWYGEALSKRLEFVVLIREPLARMQSSFYHGEQWNFHNMSFKQYVTRALANNRVGCPSGKAFDSAAATLDCAEPDNMPMGDPFYLSLYLPQLTRWLSMYQARQFTIAPFLTYVAPKKGVGSLLHHVATRRLGSAVKKGVNMKAHPKKSRDRGAANSDGKTPAGGVATQKPPLAQELRNMYPTIRNELQQVLAVNAGPVALARVLTPKMAEGLTVFGYSDKWAAAKGLGGQMYRQRGVAEWIRINW